MSQIRYRFHSLEDFLASTMLTVDGTLDDGWGASIAVKGREIEATVLFCDIAGFSARTKGLTPTETLIFVNHFFTWMTAEAIQHSKGGIIDKYIGDAVMIVFSCEFGSDDPFVDAVRVAAAMYQYDAYSFAPRIGIASGRVIVGFVGTAIRYNCSVFGQPVALAARCSTIDYEGLGPDNFSSGSVIFPAAEWKGRDLNTVVLPTKRRNSDGSLYDQPTIMKLRSPRIVPMKNLPDTEIQELVNSGMHFPSQTAEQWARKASKLLVESNRQWERSQ